MEKQRIVKRKRVAKKRGWLAMFIGNIHKQDGTKVDKIDLDRIFGLQQVFNSKHHVVSPAGGIVQVANGASNGAIFHTIGDINDAANFLACFDEYQISSVKVKFIARQNAIAAGAVATYIPGYLTTAIDFDDTAAVAIALLQDYNSATTVGSFENVTRIYRPKVSVATYGGGVLTNYQQVTPDKKLGWIDNADSSVVFNGCKWAIRAGAAAQTLLSAWDVEMTYYVRWRMSF